MNTKWINIHILVVVETGRLRVAVVVLGDGALLLSVVLRVVLIDKLPSRNFLIFAFVFSDIFWLSISGSLL